LAGVNIPTIYATSERHLRLREFIPAGRTPFHKRASLFPQFVVNPGSYFMNVIPNGSNSPSTFEDNPYDMSDANLDSTYSNSGAILSERSFAKGLKEWRF
jgi:hypothetical protein